MALEKPYLNHVLQVNWSTMASAKNGQYGGGDVVDERLMNQVMKHVKYDELGSLARQWRIQDFPEGGGVNPPGGAWTRQIFPKTAWNRKNLDAQGGACVPHAPP